MEHAPNRDQIRIAREVAERSPSALSGFVFLMFPFRCSPAIQRANKVHSAPQTTVHALVKRHEFRHWSDVLSTLSLTAPPAFRQELMHQFLLLTQPRALGLAPVVRRAACSVPLPLNERGYPWIQFSCPLDCLCLGRQHIASPASVGPSHCVITLRPSFDKQLILCHIFPPP